MTRNSITGRLQVSIPNDAESYYSIAVIVWTTSNQFRQAEREKLHVNPDDSLPVRDRNVCAHVRDRNANSVQEGIDSLITALQLRPDYDDAMAYMNLLYRERADIQCDDPAARAGDLKTADEWAAKAMQVRQAKAEKAAKLKATKLRQAQAVKKDENSEPANPPQQ
jgi:hypothetical protein